jgi:hypothetical protein
VAIYDGASRTAAARIGGVTLQIVRDWVIQCSRPWRTDRSQGARPAISVEQQPSRGAGGCLGGWSNPRYPLRGSLADCRSMPMGLGRVSRQHRPINPQP